MDSDHRKDFLEKVQGALELDLAYIGVVNGLFAALRDQSLAVDALAAATGMDPGYVHRWSEAAYAFGLLESADACHFTVSEQGRGFSSEAEGSLVPFAIQAVLSAHIAERSAGLMRTGERPGEKVLAERETVLPWFGPMLELQFGPLFATQILPALHCFEPIDAQGGLVVDLGCGNGWYLRALARRYPRLRGLGLDGFDANVTQARERARDEGLGTRLRFEGGDIYGFVAPEPAAAVTMTRALHHVWDERAAVMAKIRDALAPGGVAVFWEPSWPAELASLRDPARRVMAFQNLTEHVQGNHFLQADEVSRAASEAGLTPEVYRFAGGKEMVVVASKPR